MADTHKSHDVPEKQPEQAALRATSEALHSIAYAGTPVQDMSHVHETAGRHLPPVKIDTSGFSFGPGSGDQASRPESSEAAVTGRPAAGRTEPKASTTEPKAGGTEAAPDTKGKSADAQAAPHSNANPESTTAPIASTAQLVDIGKKLLERINPAGTGVTGEQLAKAMQDPSFKGQDAQALAAIYNAYEQQPGTSVKVTGADLDKLIPMNAARDKELGADADLVKWTDHNLAKYTSKKDGATYQSDIDAALKNTSVSATDKSYLQELSKLMPKLKDADGGRPGITSNDVYNYLEAGLLSNPREQFIENLNAPLDPVAAAESGSHSLYATKDPLDSIKPGAVTQGLIRDCYVESAIAALAKSDPAMIRDMIKDNHDGTYTVAFNGAKDDPVTVKAPTDQEMGLFNGGSKDGVWASVMEKAVGKFVEKYPLETLAYTFSMDGKQAEKDMVESKGNSALPLGYHDLLPQEFLNNTSITYVNGKLDANDMYSDAILKLFTGKDVHTTDLTQKDVSQTNVVQQLTKAFDNGTSAAATAGSVDTTDGSLQYTADGIVKSHEYTITGFQPDGHGGGTVTLRNPWGGKKGAPINLSAGSFMKDFQMMDMTV